jgi:hypothetical protein
MVPLLDPMLPEAILLFAITPALLGVVVAVLVAVAGAIAGTHRELQRTHPGSAAPVGHATRCEPQRLAA